MAAGHVDAQDADPGPVDARFALQEGDGVADVLHLKFGLEAAAADQNELRRVQREPLAVVELDALVQIDEAAGPAPAAIVDGQRHDALGGEGGGVGVEARGRLAPAGGEHHAGGRAEGAKPAGVKSRPETSTCSENQRASAA